ncbi:MAG: TetR/AcrR family transcriptional regulator [Rhodocyclaceae bacterium]|jgi:AcrR family transcriptional regulator|nr:TetR/AcrR family transcriptional regulator [Rhodocyclaceae bacterium]
MSQPVRRAVIRMPRDRRVGDIEAAAREVFCERGFEAASTAEIAARAGVAEGTLYKYFQNKRDLLIKVLEAWYKSMLSDYASQLEMVRGTRNKIFYIVSRHLRSLKENAGLARLSYHEVRHSGDYYESKIYEFNREYTQVFVDTCREGIRCGELRPDVPIGLLRDLIFGGVDHLISGFLFNKRELDVDSAAEQLVSLLFDGIAVAAPQAGSMEVVLKRFESLAERMELAQPPAASKRVPK